MIAHPSMPPNVKEFFGVLAGTASVIGVIGLGLSLLKGQEWITVNSTLILTHGMYWLLFPPAIWFFRYRPKEDSGFVSPSVRMIMDDGMLVTEPCTWMGIRTSVSVYRVQDDVEILMFPAYVVNVQSNKLVQLIPLIGEPEEPVINDLKAMKQNLLIKPGQLHDQ